MKFDIEKDGDGYCIYGYIRDVWVSYLEIESKKDLEKLKETLDSFLNKCYN